MLSSWSSKLLPIATRLLVRTRVTVIIRLLIRTKVTVIRPRKNFTDAKWPSIWTDAIWAGMLCHNPDDGCELTTTAELLDVGIRSASGACIHKFIHPHVEDMSSNGSGMLTTDPLVPAFTRDLAIPVATEMRCELAFSPISLVFCRRRRKRIAMASSSFAADAVEW
jgi:hypothetical protein